MRRYEVTVVSDGSGAATAYTPVVRGHLESIQYVKTDYANGVDFTITCETGGEGLWTDADVNASEIVRPTAPLHSQTGAARLLASGGEPVVGKIAINGRIKIVLAQAGDTKTGLFRFIVS